MRRRGDLFRQRLLHRHVRPRNHRTRTNTRTPRPYRAGRASHRNTRGSDHRHASGGWNGINRERGIAPRRKRESDRCAGHRFHHWRCLLRRKLLLHRRGARSETQPCEYGCPHRLRLARPSRGERAGISRGRSRDSLRGCAEFRPVPWQGLRSFALRHRHECKARMPRRGRTPRRGRNLRAGKHHREFLQCAVSLAGSRLDDH